MVFIFRPSTRLMSCPLSQSSYSTSFARRLPDVTSACSASSARPLEPPPTPSSEYRQPLTRGPTPFPPSALPRSNLARELFFEPFPSHHVSPPALPIEALERLSLPRCPSSQTPWHLRRSPSASRLIALISFPTAMLLRRPTMLPIGLFLTPLLGLHQVRAEGNVTCADSSVCEYLKSSSRLLEFSSGPRLTFFFLVCSALSAWWYNRSVRTRLLAPKQCRLTPQLLSCRPAMETRPASCTRNSSVSARVRLVSLLGLPSCSPRLTRLLLTNPTLSSRF